MLKIDESLKKKDIKFQYILFSATYTDELLDEKISNIVKEA